MSRVMIVSKGQCVPKPNGSESQPLLGHRPAPAPQVDQQLTKQLTARHAFTVLVTLQIGSGIFASPAQVDSTVPSPGAALLVWLLGGLLSWAGAASFAELGAALPLNGGMQEYLRHVYGDTAAFLTAWIYIVAVRPSSMAIQSIVIAESLAAAMARNTSRWLSAGVLKATASLVFVSMVLLNSISTRFTLRLSHSFTIFKLLTVSLVVIAGLVAVTACSINPGSSLSSSSDWYEKNWFHARPTVSGGHSIDWELMGAWDRYGHYCAAIYGALWAFDGWDNANVVASEIVDPGKALLQAIKAAMTIVIASFELVNVAYYILIPWAKLSASNAVAVVAATSLLGQSAGVLITVLVAISCAGSITSNMFAFGRLVMAASQRHYLPAFFGYARIASFSAKRYANGLAMLITLVYISIGNFRALLTFVGMTQWVFLVSTGIGLLILRRKEPQLERPYRPTIALPILFVIVGALVVARCALFAPIQGIVLACILALSALVSHYNT